MRLELDSVRFKNFMSFGSKWNEIHFLHGINVILGPNGSGKTSCMETIPFGLFGKTHKEIVKADLINWKNRKNLEVQEFFHKGEDKYRVVRAIKPDNFEIWKNNKLIERPSHVKYYQLLLEDIIGTNFQTFMSIIHSNINTSRPIFGMKKPDKRKFIEKVYGLVIYSRLSDKCNKKITTINTKVREAEITIDHNGLSIESSFENIRNISKKLSNFSSSVIQLNDVKEELNEEMLKLMKEDMFRELKESLDTIVEKLDGLEYLLGRFHTKKAVIGTKVKDIIKRIPEKVEYDIPTEDYQSLYDSNAEEISKRREEFRKIDRKVYSLESELVQLQKRQEKLDVGKCPTCGQDVDKTLINSLETYKSSIENNIRVIKKLHEEKDKQLKLLILNGEELLEKSEKLKTFVDNEAKRKLLILEKGKWKRVFVKLSSFANKLEEERISLNNKSSITTEEYERECTLRKGVERLRSEVKTLEDKILLEEATKKGFGSIISTEKLKIKEYQSENKKLKDSIKKLNDIKDYMKEIKNLCKDENIKSFAISSMVPELTRRTNKYLSEVGHPFYITMDAWLNPTIKGPGITSGSYNNLSSGEQKSVDLSLQNAFLDIDRIQSGIYTDILILDEILDSSLDSTSLNILLQIIKNKQKEDNSKVFIISHRDEAIEDIEKCNKLILSKEGGYSKINV